MQRLADDIFCETAWDGANVGSVLGTVLGATSDEEGFVLIDSPMLPRDARAWKSQIESHSPAPILYLINTDYHFDHIMTDCLLCERTIAHSLAEPPILAQGGEVFEQFIGAFFPDIDEEARAEIRGLRAVAPSVVFDKSLALNFGSPRVEITHMGGHTPATSVVFLPKYGILFTGDIHVHDRHPFPGDGDLLEWMDALGRVEKMDAGIIVPGHGEVCGPESVGRLKGFFEELKGLVEGLIGRGCGREEAIDSVDLLSYFPVDKGAEFRTESFITLGVGRMFDQLSEVRI